MQSRTSRAFLVCAVAVLALAYLHLLLLDVHFAPIDDHNLLVTTLAGKRFPLDIWPSQGRFDPLTGQELNLIALFAKGPAGYYAFNAVELLVLCLVLFDLVRAEGGTGRALIALAILVLLPGFAVAWLRLQVSERDSLTLFVLALWSYRRFARLRSPIAFGAAVIAANLALYCKETSFILIAVFAALRLLAQRARRVEETRALDLLLLGSAALYLALYALLIYPQWGAALYGAKPGSPLLRAVKYLGDYATTDPIVVFLVFPLAVRRGIAVLRHGAAIEPWADPLLLASAAYAASFLILGLHQPYYWLPAYAAALPALAAWSRRSELRGSRVWRVGSGLAALLLVLGAIPDTLFQISSAKYVARNYDAMLGFLAGDIERRGDRSPARVTLDRIAADSELYVSLDRFLVHRGLPRDRFELAPEAHASDYLIVTPSAGIDVDEAYLSAMGRDHRVAFGTRSEHAIPNFGIRIQLKALVLRLFPSLAAAAGIDEQTSYGVDYYVLVPR